MAESIVSDELPSLVGEKIDNWRITGTLGQGGMSIVYLAEHTWLEQSAAVKLLRPEFTRETAALQRFQQEALAASRLHHENIIEVKDFGKDPNHGYFMALELLEGTDLDTFLDDTPLPKTWLLAIFRQVCSALHATHQKRIIHRDLKPSNIFLLPGRPFPRVKLLDFGVAKVHFESTAQKLTSTGVIVGTPAYLAPEQVVPKGELTAAADMYALGVVMYQMFTGQLPLFAENTIEHVIKVIQNAPPLAGDIRPALAGTELEALLAKLLSKEPSKRPETMLDVWQELQSAGASFDDPLDDPAAFPDIEYHMSEESREKRERRRLEQSAFDTAMFATEHGEVRPHDASLLPTGQAMTGVDSLRQPRQSQMVPPQEGPNNRLLTLLLSGLLFLLTVGGGAYVLLSKKPKKVAAKPPEALPKRSELDSLVLAGMDKFKKKKLDEAIKLWKKVLRSPKYKQSRHFPSLFRTMGDAYKRKEHIHSAVTYVDRYLQAIKNLKKRREEIRSQMITAGREKDSEKLQELVSRLDKITKRIPQSDASLDAQISKFNLWKKDLEDRTKAADKLLGALTKLQKKGKFDQAFAIYQKLRKMLPSHPYYTTKIADALARRFPSLASRLYQLVALEFDSSEKLKGSLKEKQSLLEVKLQEQRKALTDLLDNTDKYITKKQLRRAFRYLRRKLDAIKFLVQSATHKQVRDWMDGHRARNLKVALGLWRVYLKKRASLEKMGLGAWILEQGKEFATLEQLKKQVEQIRQIQALEKIWQRATKSVKAGQLAVAVRHCRAYLRLWEKLKDEQLWEIRKVLEVRAAKARVWAAKYSKGTGLLYKTRRAYAQAHFNKADEMRAELLKLMQATPAFVRIEREMKSLYRRSQTGRRELNLANTKVSKLKWKIAERHYRSFLKLYASAHNKKSIKRMIKVCLCGYNGVPWEDCSQEKAYIRNLKRRRR